MQLPSFPNLDSAKLVPTIDETPGPVFDALLKKHKINKDEYERLRSVMGRAPTMAELGVFSAMWSEHCSYKSSRVHLRRFPTEGSNVVVGPGENAGVVRLSGKLCLAFKMESHNHPSYIEPYQGAATGVGGILRDVFCMGSRPVANLNALRFGSRKHPRTPHLREHVVRGIGDYGNCVGIPTVGGNVSFDDSYDGNCLVNAMTVGVIHKDRIFKGYATGQGNLVVYVGSATGRDGIHGATMASDSFGSKADSERSTVQVGDPFKEKLLLEATLEVLEKGLVIGLQDMGAAGLTSSSFEMAGRAGNGLLLDLDQVPVRTSRMTAYELLLSESQERMLMVVEPARWPELKAVLDRWLLDNAIIGVVTGTGRVQVLREGKLEADLPVAPMTDEAPKYDRPQRPRAPAAGDSRAFDEKVAGAIRSTGPDEVLLMMARATGDKRPIFQQYDHHIGTRTVHGPDEQGAGVLWMRSDWADPAEPYLGLAVTASCNERYCRLDPRAGAQHAVLKSARMIAAAGGEPLAITDCLNYGNPEDPEVMWEFAQGVDGIADACRELGIPVVSGNVSLYNETDGKSIAPTPMIGMVGKVRDVRTSPPAVLKEKSELFLLTPQGARPTFGGSLAAQLLGLDMRLGEAPKIDWVAELESMKFLRRAAAAGWLAACRDVGNGGIVATAAKMTLAKGLGLSLDLSHAPIEGGDAILRYFGEVSGTYILALTPEGRRLCLQDGQSLRYNSLVPIGGASEAPELVWGGWRCAKDRVLDALQAAYRAE
jgi:phosphoribosylformylglycinamidine synthase